MAKTPPHLAIPPDRADGTSSFVHRALVWTGYLGELSPWYFLPLGLTAGLLVGWVWTPWHIVAGLTLVLWLLLDGTMLALLPWTARSWGPVTPPLLGLGCVRLLLWLGGALLPPTPGLLLTLTANAALSAVAIYATWIEPFRVQITHQTYPGVPEGPGTVIQQDLGPGLRIVHLSDLHFEAWSRRERQILDDVEALQPDLILLTGDYLNLSSVYEPQAQAGARDFLSRLHAPLGVYAVTGSPPVDVPSIVPRIFEGLPVRWLDDEAVPLVVEGRTLWLLGVRATYDEARDIGALRHLATTTPDDALRILLYHTPDLMPEVARLGIELYLCGHTHGGQICLPFYGALATSSHWGKRYEHGRYQQDGTTLYVSRGLGMEGLGAPRARFLAPPEIVVWYLED